MIPESISWWCCHLITIMWISICHQRYSSACQSSRFDATVNVKRYLKLALEWYTETKTTISDSNNAYVSSLLFFFCRSVLSSLKLLPQHLFKLIWVVNTCYFCPSPVGGSYAEVFPHFHSAFYTSRLRHFTHNLILLILPKDPQHTYNETTYQILVCRLFQRLLYSTAVN